MHALVFRGDYHCTIFYAYSRPFRRGIVAALKGMETERVTWMN